MNQISKKIRSDIIKISNHSGHGHIPTCFSIVELVIACYECMHYDSKNPSRKDRDIFILSKGHGALTLYCVLSHLGFFPIQEVYDFGSFESKFGCHPDRHTVPGIELSTGSLGHGIGVAVGVALGFKLAKNNRKVFVLIGDGESNEGTVWEAMMIAENYKLDNLYVIFDFNQSQKRCLPITNAEEKFSAFGAETIVVDGHDVNEIKVAINKPTSGRPRVVIANTVKGKGCKTLENEMFAWHRRSPNNDEMKQLIRELNETSI